jgi:hypothetical protein
MQLLARERRFRRVVWRGWVRLIDVTRPRYRALRHPSARQSSVGSPPLASAFTPTALAVDPVALTVLAVNRLGPATLRTVANGKPLTVAVPDARTGEIFRAALREMQKTRLTDRLIEIVVDTGADAQRAPSRA